MVHQLMADNPELAERHGWDTLSRREATLQNHANAKDSMHFTPLDGRCWSCQTDLVEHYGVDRFAAGINITGCPKCHKSYCD
jgi:hypothetical protein